MKTVARPIFALAVLAALVDLNSASAREDAPTSSSRENVAIQEDDAPEAKALRPAIAPFIDEFALDFYRASISARDNAAANAVVAPFGARRILNSFALAAAGQTKAELRRALRRGESEQGSGDARVAATLRSSKSVEVADSIWVRDAAVRTDFLAKLAKSAPDVEFLPIDASDSLSAQNQALERWFRARTHDLLGSPVKIDAQTSLVFGDAIYFLGRWLRPFDPTQTRESKFRTLKGQTTAEMMSKNQYLRVAFTNDALYLELPCEDEDFLFVAVKPNVENFLEFERNFDAEKLAKLELAASYNPIELSFPKFKIEESNDLIPTLKQLGINALFQKPDLSAGFVDSNLGVGEFRQNAVVAVDERGVTAAATTGATLTRGVARPKEATFDSPFLFFIRMKNGPILFVGRCVNPSNAEETSLDEPDGASEETSAPADENVSDENDDELIKDDDQPNYRLQSFTPDKSKRQGGEAPKRILPVDL